MIFDDLNPSDSSVFFNNGVDYSIYDTEEKKFLDEVLGLYVNDETKFTSMGDTRPKEEDQTVPTKVTELMFGSVASPAGVLRGEWLEPTQENIRAPPPSYEEHKVFSKFHTRNFSCEDLAARWQDIEDIITRESSIPGDDPLTFSVLKSAPLQIGTDDPFQSPRCSDGSRITETSDFTKSSIAQSPDWYSISVQESSFYSISSESTPLVPSPRSSNSSPAPTPRSFTPTYNTYSASPSSNPNYFDPSSRCTPSPLCNKNKNSTNQASNNKTTSTNNTGQSSGMICGMSYQQLKAHIPESGHIQLWQFLIKLLCEPSNENCIRWEGVKGHFTIVNQNELAKRWGDRKRRKHMTYEKLSRAIRYYYDKNYVQKIHGKKATYVFNFDELFKSQSRPSQKSKESNDLSGRTAPLKIPTYQNSPSSSPSPSTSYVSCAQSSSVGNNQSTSTYSPEMSSFIEFGLPHQTKVKVEPFDGFNNRVPKYLSHEPEYNTNISFYNGHSFLEEDNMLSYY